MAEAATLQLEMKYLAYLTGNETYWRKAERVMKVLDDNNMEAGLLPIYVSPQTGKFTSREIRLGSRGDSYYGEFPPDNVTECWNANVVQNTLSSSTCRHPVKNPSTSTCGKKHLPASRSISSCQQSMQG
jgi:hypothetical protein